MEGRTDLTLLQRITSLWKQGISRAPFFVDDRPTTETSVSSQITSAYLQRLKLGRYRKDRYRDFDGMDEEHPEISSALGVNSDNATNPKKETGDPFWIESDDERVNEILEDCIERLKLKKTVWDITRNTAVYGEEFDELIVNTAPEVARLKLRTPETMHRNEDFSLASLPYRRFTAGHFPSHGFSFLLPY